MYHPKMSATRTSVRRPSGVRSRTGLRETIDNSRAFGRAESLEYEVFQNPGNPAVWNVYRHGRLFDVVNALGESQTGMKKATRPSDSPYIQDHLAELIRQRSH